MRVSQTSRRFVDVIPYGFKKRVRCTIVGVRGHGYIAKPSHLSGTEYFVFRHFDGTFRPTPLENMRYHFGGTNV